MKVCLGAQSLVTVSSPGKTPGPGWILLDRDERAGANAAAVQVERFTNSF